MRPYPWTERRRFPRQSMTARSFRKLVWPFTILAAIFAPVTVPVRLWAFYRFDRMNDAWWVRGWAPLVVGVVGMFWFTFKGWALSWVDLFRAPSVGSVLWWLVAGLGPGMILCAFAVWCSSYEYEWLSQRYLERTRQGWWGRRREEKNRSVLRAGRPLDGVLKAGVIVDDIIPWRTPRIGMIVGRPLERLGHGYILGTSGTGKTVTAGTLSHYAVGGGASVGMIDFKASADTREMMRAVAAEHGVPFYSFDLGIGSREISWYDPLAWEGASSEKASMLVQSFKFDEGGGAGYYKGVAETWLPLQFDVMEEIGLNPGESRFDFLLSTCSPNALRDRMKQIRDPQLKADLSARAGEVAAKDLTSLRNNLAKVVNAAGTRLRPRDDVPVLSLARAANEGAVFYIGLSSSTDNTALKAIGSMAIRDLSAFVGQRGRVNDKSVLRPMVVFIDEAANLKEQTVVMEDIFTTARESVVWLWPVTQGFSAWPDAVRQDLTNNALTAVVHRIQEKETMEQAADALSKIPTLEETAEDRTSESAFRSGRSVESDGESRTSLTMGPHVRPDQFAQTADRHSIIFFSGSQTRATVAPWKSRRVKREMVHHDAPLVEIVPPDYLIRAKDSGEGESFMDLAGGLTVASAAAEGGQSFGQDAAAWEVHGPLEGEVGLPEWSPDGGFLGGLASSEVVSEVASGSGVVGRDGPAPFQFGDGDGEEWASLVDREPSVPGPAEPVSGGVSGDAWEALTGPVAGGSGEGRVEPDQVLGPVTGVPSSGEDDEDEGWKALL